MDTLPPPATPTYNLQVSSGDLASMLLQQQLDLLDAEIEAARKIIQGAHDELQAILDSKYAEAKAEYAKIADKVEGLANAFRALYPESIIHAGLDENKTSASVIFGAFFNNGRNYYTFGAVPSAYYVQLGATLAWAWAIGAKDSDIAPGYTLHTGEIRIRWTSAELEKLDSIIAHANAEGYARVQELSTKRENAPELERQVRAKLTQMFLSTQPELRAQLDSIFPKALRG